MNCRDICPLSTTIQTRLNDQYQKLLDSAQTLRPDHGVAATWKMTDLNTEYLVHVAQLQAG
jgi:hypothetical protein